MKSLTLSALLFAAPSLAADTLRAFGPGEQSTYKVTWLGMPAGEAQITVGAATAVDGKTVWPIVCTARTTAIARVYPIQDKFVSWWHDESGSTMGYDFWANEARKRRHEKIRFGPDGKAQVTRQLEGQPLRESEWDVEQGTLDIAAAAMALRRVPLSDGAQVQFPVFLGNRNVVMQAQVVGKEKLDTALGETEAWKLEITTGFGGKLAGKRELLLYLSADQRQVPVKIDAEFVLGNILVDLVGYAPGSVGEGAR